MGKLPASPPQRTRALPIAAGAGALAVALAAAFAIGRWTAEPPAPPAPAAEPPAAPEAPPEPLPPPAAARPASAEKPRPAPPAPPAPVPDPAAIAQAVVARATEQARDQIESLRAQIVSRCWPAGGLPGGRSSATLSFNVAFDAQGREIARGISEQRRAPAGEFARCLRKMEAPLSISPPGTNVGVSFAVTFP